MSRATAPEIARPPARRAGWLFASLASDTAAKAVSLGTAAVTTPVVLHAVGLSRYGIVVLTTTVLSLVSNIDGGLVGSLQRYLTTATSDSTGQTVRRLVRSMSVVLPLIGLVAAALVYAGAPLIIGATHIESSLRQDSIDYLRLVCLTMPVTLLADVYIGLLRSQHRWPALSTIQSGAQILYAGVLLVLLSQGRGLFAIGLATICQAAVSALLAIGYGVARLRAVPAQSSPEPGYWMSRSEWGAILRHARGMFSTNLSVVINLEFDAIVLAAFFPIKFLGIYAVAVRFATMIRGLPMGALAGYVTEFSRGVANSSLQVADVLTAQRRWVSTMSGFSVVAVGVAVPALHLWLGPDYRLAGVMAAVLLLGYGVNLMTGILTCYLRAIDRPDIEARYSWATTLINAGFTVAAGIAGWPFGVVLATSLAHVVGSASLMYFARPVVGARLAYYLREIPATRVILMTAISAPACGLLLLVPLTGVVGLLVAGIVAGCLLGGFLLATGEISIKTTSPPAPPEGIGTPEPATEGKLS